MNEHLDAFAARAMGAPDPSALRVRPEIVVLAPVPRDPDPVKRRRPQPEEEPAAAPSHGGRRRRAIRSVIPEPSVQTEPGPPVPPGLGPPDRPAGAAPPTARRPEVPVEVEPGEQRRIVRGLAAASPAAVVAAGRAQQPAAAVAARPAPQPSPSASDHSAHPAPPERAVALPAALTARRSALPGMVEPPRTAPPARAAALAAADAPARLRPSRREAPPRTAASAEQEPAPVEIVIDRIDVRLTAPAPRPAHRSAPAPSTHLSLAEYLDRRSRG